MPYVDKLTWSDIEKLINKTVNTINKDLFDVIYGAPRGGLIPAVMLSHRLGLPMIDRITDDKRILYVEDIIDTGKCIEDIVHKQNITIVSLFLNIDHCETFPDMYMRETTSWIQMPWEIGITDSVSNVNYEDRNED